MQDSQTDEETGAPCMEVEKQPMLPPWEPQQRHDASTDRIQGPADTSLEQQISSQTQVDDAVARYEGDFTALNTADQSLLLSRIFEVLCDQLKKSDDVYRSDQSQPPMTENSGFLHHCGERLTTWFSSFCRPQNSSQPQADTVVDSAVIQYEEAFKTLNFTYRTRLVWRMFEVLCKQVKHKLDTLAEAQEKVKKLEGELQGTCGQLWECEQKLQLLEEDLDAEREQMIKVAKMSGVIQKTAEHDMLETAVKSYFSDDLPGFVNYFKGEAAIAMENQISKHLPVAFHQGSETLVPRIVQFCESPNCSSDVAKAYSTVKEKFKMDPQEALKRFLLAKVYQEATEQTLSESDWELRKITSFLKSAFFEGEGKACMTSVEEAMRGTFKFLSTAADVEKGIVSQSAVDTFLSTTVCLLQEMLMSESPIIPWTELKTFEPRFVEVDPRQLGSIAMSEDDFCEYEIVGFKRPILLSCNHRQVKIYKGKVRLAMPQ